MAKATEIIISAKDQTRQAFDSVRGNLLSINSLLGAVGVVGFASMVKQAADFADEIGEAAEKIGISSRSLSELKYAAELTGGSFESLQAGTKRLSESILAASEGSKIAKDAFASVGVSIKDQEGNLKSVDDILLELSDRFAKLPDGTQKTAVAMRLLGKSGADLIPLLNQGSSGIRNLADEAQRLGVVIDDEAAEAAGRLNDNIDRMGKSFQGFKLAAAQDLVPALAQITDAMSEALKEGGLLTALFVGLGGVAANVLGLDDLSQAKDRLSEINREVTSITDQLAGGKKRSVKGLVKLTEEDVQSLTLRLKDLGLEAAKIDSFLNPKASAKPTSAGTPGFVTPVDDNNSEAERAYDKQLAGFRKYQEDLAKTILEFQDAAGGGDLDPSAKLQKQLDTLQKLTPAIQDYLQGLINIAKQQELDARQAEINLAFDERELAQLEAATAAEEALLQTREQAYATFRDNLLRQNEDLNVELIASDRKRAEAQLQLEYDRSLETINALVLEYEERQQLIDELDKNFALKTENLAKNGVDSMAELQRAVEGFGQSAGDAFVDFAFKGEASVSNLVDSILQDLARLAIKRSITDPIFSAVDGSGIFDGLAGAFGGLFGGARATGGPVDPSKFYLVGEKGPELFSPSSAGTIIPNDFSGGGTSYNVSVSVDASGGKVQGDTAAAGELGRKIEGAVRQVLLQEKRQGGMLA